MISTPKTPDDFGLTPIAVETNPALTSALITQQAHEYALNRTTPHYGEKGYFDIDDFTWHTQVVRK